MSTLLQTYEEDFKESVKRAGEELNAIRETCQRKRDDYMPSPATGPQSRIRRCVEVEKLLAHLRELIGTMEYESHDVHASQRQTLRHRITEYQKQLTKLESTLASVKSDCGVADRLDLVGQAGKSSSNANPSAHPGDDPDEEHRRIMLDNTNKFRDASNTLLKAERVLNDTEVVGTEALQNLRQQTEQLQNLHEVTIAVDDEISESRKILQRVQQGMIKQKATLIGIAVFLIILIIIAIYVFVRKHRNNTYTPPTPSATEPPPVAPTYSTPTPNFKIY